MKLSTETKWTNFNRSGWNLIEYFCNFFSSIIKNNFALHLHFFIYLSLFQFYDIKSLKKNNHINFSNEKSIFKWKNFLNNCAYWIKICSKKGIVLCFLRLIKSWTKVNKNGCIFYAKISNVSNFKWSINKI